MILLQLFCIFKDGLKFCVYILFTIVPPSLPWMSSSVLQSISTKIGDLEWPWFA